MRYQILIMKRAKWQLDKLPLQIQERIAEGVGKLGCNPDDVSLDIKSLTNDNEARYRLRVGNYRVKFNRDDEFALLKSCVWGTGRRFTDERKTSNYL